LYFWDANAACDEWELEGCDVDGALAWATAGADGRTFTLYSVVRGPGELGANEVALARLFGTDPTQSNPNAVRDEGAFAAWVERDDDEDGT
jgi:hypothetical protein